MGLLIRQWNSTVIFYYFIQQTQGPSPVNRQAWKGRSPTKLPVPIKLASAPSTHIPAQAGLALPFQASMHLPGYHLVIMVLSILIKLWYTSLANLARQFYI